MALEVSSIITKLSESTFTNNLADINKTVDIEKNNYSGCFRFSKK